MKKSVRFLIIAVLIILGIIIGFQSNITDEVNNEDIVNNEYALNESKEEIIEFQEEPKQTTCTKEDKIFNYPPVNLEKTKVVVPLGLMSGNHVTPIDHQYFQDFDNDKADIEVYSPTSGIITNMQHMSGEYFDSSKVENIEWSDYRVTIQHNCDIESIYIHIDKLSEKLQAVAPDKGAYKSLDVSVEAGEVIGWYQNNVDYNLVDQNVVREGLLVPEHYASEPWKIHVPNTLDYFNIEIKEAIIQKSLRIDEPIAGKFDYDIKGRVIGNWFTEGTSGYTGANQENYWIGHLSISPDYIDPSHFIISLGDYKGEPKQFGIKTNTPNPTEVTKENGIITYELVNYEYYAGYSRWDRISLFKGIKAINGNEVFGVILVELMEGNRMKVEVFEDKKKSEVNGFTENVKIYER